MKSSRIHRNNPVIVFESDKIYLSEPDNINRLSCSFDSNGDIINFFTAILKDVKDNKLDFNSNNPNIYVLFPILALGRDVLSPTAKKISYFSFNDTNEVRAMGNKYAYPIGNTSFPPDLFVSTIFNQLRSRFIIEKPIVVFPSYFPSNSITLLLRLLSFCGIPPYCMIPSHVAQALHAQNYIRKNLKKKSFKCLLIYMELGGCTTALSYHNSKGEIYIDELWTNEFAGILNCAFQLCPDELMRNSNNMKYYYLAAFCELLNQNYSKRVPIPDFMKMNGFVNKIRQLISTKVESCIKELKLPKDELYVSCIGEFIDIDSILNKLNVNYKKIYHGNSEILASINHFHSTLIDEKFKFTSIYTNQFNQCINETFSILDVSNTPELNQITMFGTESIYVAENVQNDYIYKQNIIPTITEKLNLDIGIILYDGTNSVIIERGELLPCSKAITYFTTHDQQTYFEFAIWKGTPGIHFENQLIDVYRSGPIEPHKARKTKVTIRVCVDTSHKVLVAVKTKYGEEPSEEISVVAQPVSAYHTHLYSYLAIKKEYLNPFDQTLSSIGIPKQISRIEKNKDTIKNYFTLNYQSVLRALEDEIDDELMIDVDVHEE